MRLIPTTLKLPPDMLHVLDDIAREQDVTTGHLVRAILNKELSRLRNARPPIRADEQLVAPLRARLASDLASAETWEDLQTSLRSKGFELRQAGGGLALHRYPDGARVCKASELGFSYSKLIARLHQPFPGHTHTHIFDRVMRNTHDVHMSEFDVIERPQRTICPSGQVI